MAARVPEVSIFVRSGFFCSCSRYACGRSGPLAAGAWLSKVGQRVEVAYRQVASGTFASCQTLSDLVCDFILLSARNGYVLDGLFFEFDRHCDAQLVIMYSDCI